MVDIFGADWKRQLQPDKAEEGCFTNGQMEEAKALNVKLRTHVTEYIGKHVLNMAGQDLAKLSSLVVAVYAIVLHPKWPLADVILRRLQKEDEVWFGSLAFILRASVIEGFFLGLYIPSLFVLYSSACVHVPGCP